MRIHTLRLILAFSFMAASSFSLAADGIETKPLQFAKGESSATVQDSLQGDSIIDYKLRANAGQTMRVALTTNNSANYFNVLPPGSDDVAIFIGSTEGNEWSGTLAADGEYTIRIYLMRSAARRGELADYTLSVGITGRPASASLGVAPARDAKVAGTPYHATGQVQCSMGSEPKGSALCDFGVIRGALGNAEVHVTPPGGFTRVITFIGDKVTVDDDAAVAVTKVSDLWSVSVNDYEHYEIPEALVSGG